MNLQFFTTRMAANAEAIEKLLKGVDDAQAQWRPTPAKWSLLEVVCHLVDEERLDFRPRLDMMLHRKGEVWPKIDPVAWVTEHDYAKQNLKKQLRAFRTERTKSIEWLGGLGSSDWKAVYKHPSLGEITTSNMVGAWVAHDYLHLRQMTRLHYEYLAHSVAPHALDYAGTWNPNV